MLVFIVSSCSLLPENHEEIQKANAVMQQVLSDFEGTILEPGYNVRTELSVLKVGYTFSNIHSWALDSEVVYTLKNKTEEQYQFEVVYKEGQERKVFSDYHVLNSNGEVIVLAAYAESGTEYYDPNDCFRVLGLCERKTVEKSGKTVVHQLETSYSNGVWVSDVENKTDSSLRDVTIKNIYHKNGTLLFRVIENGWFTRYQYRANK